MAGEPKYFGSPMKTKIIKDSCLVAVFRVLGPHKGFVSRPLLEVTGWGLPPGSCGPLQVLTYYAIEVEPGTEVFWPVYNQHCFKYTGDKYKEAEMWGFPTVTLPVASPLPVDLHQVKEIQPQ